MWVRMQLKIGWGALAYGAVRCVLPPSRIALETRLERLWSPHAEDALTCFSVRSGFDLLLQALNLPAHSEILFSALNVKGMVNIVRRHDLTPVPVDLDFGTMAPRPELIEQAITEKTRAIVVAHLFGARFDLGPVIDIARRHDLLVIEDCAQCFEGTSYTGHPQADVALFSFGPLKTATALGGALLRIRDAGLRNQMRQIQSTYPVQTTASYLVRILKFSALKVVTTRPFLAAIYKLFDLLGKDYEDAIGNSVRGVAKLGSNKNLRYRPSGAMLAMLEHRLTTWSSSELDARTRAAKTLLHALGDTIPVPSKANDIHTYWAFPVVADNPKEVIRALRQAGFDAANLPRSQAVEPPEDRPQLAPVTARNVLRDLVILPCHPGMPASELKREADLVTAVLKPPSRHQTAEEGRMTAAGPSGQPGEAAE